MNADQILATSHPRILFGEKPDKGYYDLLKKWHPDVSKDPKAEAVTAHINRVWDAVKSGSSIPGGLLTIKTSAGEKHYEVIAERPTEIGTLYICKRHLIWAIARSHDHLAHRWLDCVKSFSFPSEKLKKEFSVYLPKNSHVVGNGNTAYVIQHRAPESIRLSDILARQGPLDPRHVAWILSGMYNMSCWLGYSGMRHCAITLDNYFVEPSSHIGSLLGGWFYASPKGKDPLAAPTVMRTRYPDLKGMDRNLLHLSQIRQCGREMLGATTLYQLKNLSGVPAPIRDWLSQPAGKDPIGEYRRWQEVVPAAFGGRRFTEYKLTAADVYS